MFANASNMFSRVLKKCGMGEDDDHLQVASITACNAPKKAAHKSVVGVKAAWATDTNNCGSCETRFGLFKRRHHCRSCGICVCADCSPHKATVAGYSTPQIICSSCETERSVIAKRKQALVLLAGVRVGAASSTGLKATQDAVRAWRERLESAKVEVTVRLNVYNLTGLAMRVVGAYHSGVEITIKNKSGKEITLDESTFDGQVIEHTPKSPPGESFRFCQTVEVGTVRMLPETLAHKLDSVWSEFDALEYHLIQQNCNSYTEALVRNLSGKAIPAWINRPANLLKSIMPRRRRA